MNMALSFIIERTELEAAMDELNAINNEGFVAGVAIFSIYAVGESVLDCKAGFIRAVVIRHKGD